MKKIATICLIAAGVVLLSASCCRGKKAAKCNSCETATAETTGADMHNSRNSLDYTGTYEGILPCADCEGIKTTLTLTYNKYTLMSEYIGGRGDNNVFTSEGTFAWNKDGNIITLNGSDRPDMYMVGENVLYCLDGDGNRVTGALADNYSLKKTK